MTTSMTAQRLAKHLCLSLNTRGRDQSMNYAHEVDDHGHHEHAGACCHCWAAANVLMTVLVGVEDAARTDERSRKPREGDLWIRTDNDGAMWRYGYSTSTSSDP